MSELESGEDDEYVEIRRDIQECLNQAVKSFYDEWNRRGWDIIVKLDFKIVREYVDGGAWQEFSYKEPTSPIEKERCDRCANE